LLRSKIAWETSNDKFITDRTTVDVITYYALHDSRHVPMNAITRALDHFDRYTHVFFFPMDSHFAPGDDPQRLTSRGYHHTFETLLTGWLLPRHAGKFWSLRNFKTLEERLELVLSKTTP